MSIENPARPLLNYEVSGNANGPTLLLLHGLMSSVLQWELNLERLRPHLQLVLVDLIGHGASPTPSDPEPYRVSSTIKTLEQIRQTLGLERWWVGGHSMGGATAIRYALAHQSRTEGVVFTNTRAGFAVPRAGQDGVASVRETPDSLRSLPYHPIHAKRFPEDLKTRMVAAADAMKPFALQQIMVNRNDLSCLDDLQMLTMPTRLINGRYERAFQPCVEIALDIHPALEVIELEAGHAVNIEAAEGYDRSVLDFIGV